MFMYLIQKFTISLTLLLAFVLQIIPLPTYIDAFRPDWVLLALSYWTLALPHRVNVGIAFVCGLGLDIVQGTTLGIHSLATSVVVFVLATNYQRLRNYPIWQQSVIVGLLSAFYHLVVFWLQHTVSDIYFMFHYLAPTISNMMAWFYVFFLMRKVRRSAGVH